MARIASRPLSDTLASPTGLTAAATPVNTKAATTGGKQLGGDEAWKKEAWQAYDDVGELGFVCRWVGKALSRARLVASDIGPDGMPTGTTDDQMVSDIVHDIAGGPAGQATMLERTATGLTVVGETWIATIVRHDGEGDGRRTWEEWHVLSSEEITTIGTKITLKLQDGTDHEFDADKDLLTRVHQPHPKNARKSDAPTRGALDPLRELKRSAATLDGASKSRLAGNGILLVPSEISMTNNTAPTGDPDAPGLPPAEPTGPQDHQVTASDLMVQLQQVMTQAISDPTSAAAMVPIVLKAPGEQLKNVQHLTLDSDIPEMALKTRDSAIRRLSLSLDVPPEVLTGVGGTNHWNAWAIDASSVNTHVVPLLTLICDALTNAVLRPLLRKQGHPDPESVTVWFDVSSLTQKTNRTEDAVTAFNAGVINAAALRRELGFGDDDAPEENMTDAEKRALAIQMVSRAPSLLPLLADVIGIEIDKTAVPAATGGNSTPEVPTTEGAPS